MSAVPEIDVVELADRLKSEGAFVLLDVRELWELDRAALRDPRLQIIPTSRMTLEQSASVADLPRDAEILVLCHHGVRSANVTRWMLALGWQRVYSVRGRIHDYALKVDGSVGMY
jgi:rhodanese-related sulfurtransferase